MRRRRLGKTDAHLPVVGLGTTGTGPLGSRDAEKDAGRVRVLREAVDLGLDFIDTAELYGGGHAEEIVGEAVSEMRDRVFIASKFNPDNASRASMARSLEASLRRLRTDHVDLYQAHWPNPFIPLEETMEGLAALQRAGKIRHIGVSNFSLPELEAACRVAPIASIQLEYNLLERGIEAALLPWCRAAGITVLAYSPFARGRLIPRLPALARLAAECSVSPSSLALGWVLHQEGVVALAMTRSSAHLRELAQAAESGLDPGRHGLIERAVRFEMVRLPARAIIVSRGDGSPYASLEEAMANREDLIPHPVQLAERIRRYGVDQPVQVAPDPSGSDRYALVGGALWYWAWVAVHGWEKPLAAIVAQAR
jgi:aryl-alcohol dehydrogenase-like predicted oxidoreductase